MKVETKNSVVFMLLCLSICFTVSFYGQGSSGIITYRGVINQTYVDSFLTDLNQKDIPMNIKQGVADMYLNASEDEYFLHFENEESYFYHNTPVDFWESYDAGSKVGTSPFYTNNKTDTIVEESGSLGRIAHQPLEWELTNQTKNIGGYTCYQAVATEKLFHRRGHYYTREVIAWFAPSIPLNFGPKYYKGLPGLILQIERDIFTITATDLELNPEDTNIRIKRLDEGATVITQEESHRRIKEMTAESDRMWNN